MDIMIDLETMSTKPNAAITAIGAVKFDETGVLDSFYRPVHLQSSMDAGLAVDADTIVWWMKQSDAARSLYDYEVNKPVELREALTAFASWIDECAGCTYVYGNGANFDNVVLRSAYTALGFQAPWPFWNDRCYRTLKSLNPSVEIVRSGTHHNALDDARDQAEHLIRVMKTQ